MEVTIPPQSDVATPYERHLVTKLPRVLAAFMVVPWLCVLTVMFAFTGSYISNLIVVAIIVLLAALQFAFFKKLHFTEASDCLTIRFGECCTNQMKDVIPFNGIDAFSRKKFQVCEDGYGVKVHGNCCTKMVKRYSFGPLFGMSWFQGPEDMVCIRLKVGVPSQSGCAAMCQMYRIIEASTDDINGIMQLIAARTGKSEQSAEL